MQFIKSNVFLLRVKQLLCCRKTTFSRLPVLFRLKIPTYKSRRIGYDFRESIQISICFLTTIKSHEGKSGRPIGHLANILYLTQSTKNTILLNNPNKMSSLDTACVVITLSKNIKVCRKNYHRRTQQVHYKHMQIFQNQDMKKNDDENNLSTKSAIKLAEKNRRL